MSYRWGDIYQSGVVVDREMRRSPAYGIMVSPDGSRKVVLIQPSRDVYPDLISINWPSYLDGILPDEFVGRVVTHNQSDGGPRLNTSINHLYYPNGAWLTQPILGTGRDVDGGSMYSAAPTTHAEEYYRIRRILGEHALRYMDENPIAAMRLSDPAQHRIHTVSYELTDEERAKAGNNDYQIRGTIGLLWRLNEGLRIMEDRTPEQTALWQSFLGEIEELLVPFCALCDGAGMSYRTIRRHPHVDWEKYQKAGLRISSDRAFNTTSLAHYGMLNPEAHRIDLENFERAADYAAEGHADDDFNLPPFRGRARVIPSIPTPQMPDFGGDITRDYLVAGYRTVYDRFKATPPEGFDPGIIRKWITLQLLAILDNRNLINDNVVDAIEINYEFTKRLHEGWSHNFNTSHAPVNVYATPFPTYFWYSNPAFGALRQRQDVYMTDAPATPADSDDIVWVDTAERDRRLDLVDQILGDATPRQ